MIKILEPFFNSNLLYIYKNIKNTFLNKGYFTTYIAFSSSIKIEIFHKVTWKLNLQNSFS